MTESKNTSRKTSGGRNLCKILSLNGFISSSIPTKTCESNETTLPAYEFVDISVSPQIFGSNYVLVRRKS